MTNTRLINTFSEKKQRIVNFYQTHHEFFSFPLILPNMFKQWMSEDLVKLNKEFDELLFYTLAVDNFFDIGRNKAFGPAAVYNPEIRNDINVLYKNICSEYANAVQGIINGTEALNQFLNKYPEVIDFLYWEIRQGGMLYKAAMIFSNPGNIITNKKFINSICNIDAIKQIGFNNNYDFSVVKLVDEVAVAGLKLSLDSIEPWLKVDEFKKIAHNCISAFFHAKSQSSTSQKNKRKQVFGVGAENKRQMISTSTMEKPEINKLSATIAVTENNTPSTNSRVSIKGTRLKIRLFSEPVIPATNVVEEEEVIAQGKVEAQPNILTKS